jgi:hypothetical protein
MLPARLLLTVALTCVAFLIISYLTQTEWSRRARIHGIVPGHHFVYYLRAFEAIAYACGLMALAEWSRSALARWDRRWHRAGELALPLMTAVAIAAAVLEYPRYAQRFDFVGERIIAQRMFADKALLGMYDWLRQNTSSADVVLASPSLSQSVVATSGRKVVAVDKLFSNPYVDWGARAQDRDAMERSLERGEWTPFLTLAGRYRVGYVARRGRLPETPESSAILSVAWQQDEWVIYRIGGRR